MHASALALKQRWERLARSPRRDYYVASHAGWDDGETWTRHARDVAGFVFQGMADERLLGAHVLEIGCGVGRLTPFVAGRVRSYTGIDIAPSLVAEAQRRCAGVVNARFFETDGTSVPAAACDRAYDLIFAAAVFIHCPREVTLAMLHAGWGLIAPGGELRFQLLADVSDTGGLEVPPEALAEIERAQQEEVERGRAQAEDAGETEPLEEDYMGHAFGWEEARGTCAAIFGREAGLLRFGHAFIFGAVRRESGGDERH